MPMLMEPLAHLHAECIVRFDDESLPLESEGSEEQIGDVEKESEDAAELARIINIERLLDMMNVASDELNSAQKNLGVVEKMRQRALNLWAIGSARLARAIGDDRISKAAPHYRQQRELATARSQVATTSAAFLKASGSRCSEARCEKLAKRHAKQVAEYQAAQQNVEKSSKGTSVPQARLLENTAPYFEAEAAHLTHLEELSIANVRCSRQIASAKARYHEAMRGLEAMSEAEHVARKTKSEPALRCGR